MRTEPYRDLCFVLTPACSLMSLSSAVEVLRQANRTLGEASYRWRLLSVDGAPVTCSAGIVLPVDGSLGESGPTDLVVVVGGLDQRNLTDTTLHGALRRLAGRGVALGAISLGSYALARAGLLDGYRCTVHWENLEAFREEFPHIEVTTEVFEVDRDRLTCSGGTAAMDMMLHLVRGAHGEATATRIAEVYMHERIRDTDDRQRMPLRTRVGVSHPQLLRVIELIESDTDHRYTQRELANRVGLSNRHLERLFKRHLGTTPRQFYLEHRLGRARSLLRQTSLDIIEVALACGFATASHFTKSYRNHFGCTPGRERASPRPEAEHDET